MKNKKHSLEFGKKEKVQNYTCQTYQLSRPNKVGAVMALIRECQPASIEDWEKWYFENAYTESKERVKITDEVLASLGQCLYKKIKEIVIPDWQAAFEQLTLDDCIDYIYNLTINRTYDGYIREKSVIHDGLAKIFPDMTFEESDPELDHALDIDYIGLIGEKTIGIQIKPVTAQYSFGNYNPSERMKASFRQFEEDYNAKVFVVFSLDGEIANKEVIDDISTYLKQ